MSITLVLGLGNPGRDYADTRHNFGWLVLDALAAREGLIWKTQSAFQAETTRWDHPSGRPVLLAKPLTFMNESGRSAYLLRSYYKVPVAAVAAIYDDLNLDLGLIKVSTQGSPGGHNGVASLIDCLGSGFVRYRLGIGPKFPTQMDLKDFVLAKFTPEQRNQITQQINHYLSGLDLLLTSGTERAMNSLNRRAHHEPE
jgi:PTH1 family peptidyl-tRNA hydrolase